MAVIDIIIGAAILFSVVVGIFRGLVKEALSLASLLFAIWAALYFGPDIGNVAESWLSSEELQTWFGRIVVFVVILAAGGLLSWALSRLVRWSVLSGVDRFLGAIFGLCRGVLLIAVLVIGGRFAGFDNDDWWLSSRAIPHLELVAEWIEVMAPKGFEILTSDGAAESLSLSVPAERIIPARD